MVHDNLFDTGFDLVCALGFTSRGAAVVTAGTEEVTTGRQADIASTTGNPKLTPEFTLELRPQNSAPNSPSRR